MKYSKPMKYKRERRELVIIIIAVLIILVLSVTVIKSIIDTHTNDNTEVSEINPYAYELVTSTDVDQGYVISHKVEGSDPYLDKFTINMDIRNRMDISEYEMNDIINYFTRFSENENSIFKGKGKLFCEVSNKYGIDPIFILIITADTYGWSYTEDKIELSYYENATDQFAYEVDALASFIHDTYYVKRNCHTLKELVSDSNYKYAIREDWAITIAGAIDEAYKVIINKEDI